VKTRYREVEPYTTKDGSTIRELMHPQAHGNRNQSLAEAIVEPGAATRLHAHVSTEEIYHVTAGRGRMTLGKEEFTIGPGDTVCIPPGTPHRVSNTGKEPLRILCACSPPYAHDDTRLL
jgi:mannose-6-phosphate isomerase-like protein (cupin superfamily)